MTASAPAPERILQRLDWQIVRRLDGLLQGDYRSLFRGNGVDFADLREYQFGDDIRHIDWNVTARMDAPYIREYLEDREITAWFLLDLSPSVDFGTVESERQKRSVLIDFVTTLARVLTRHGNRVGAIFYGSRVERTIPARGGRVQVLRLINDLVSHPRRDSAPFTDLTPLLEAGQRWIKGRSLVFVDLGLHQRVPGWERPLEGLTQRSTRSSRSGCSTGARPSCPTSGRSSSTTPRRASSSYVDTHDATFRRRFGEAAERREADLARVVPAGRRRRGLAGDRRRRAGGDRPDGRPEAAGPALTMSFIWPPLLLLLLAIPVGVAIYRRREAPRAARAAAFGWGSGAGRRRGAPRPRPARSRPRRRGPWLRRLPAILTVAGMTILVLSLARPQSVIGVPRLEGTVLLAFDVSGSMAATDVAPSRMEAAKTAALEFVQNASRARCGSGSSRSATPASRPRSRRTSAASSWPRSSASSRSAGRRSRRGSRRR